MQDFTYLFWGCYSQWQTDIDGDLTIASGDSTIISGDSTITDDLNFI